jgi:trimeric autotransporter adhesin
MQHRLGIGKRAPLAVAVLLVSGMGAVLAFSSPAAAADTLVVSPSTGLTNGQTVTVAASGYPADATGAILECNTAPGQPTIALGAGVNVGCTNPLTALATTDANGNLASTNFSVVEGNPGAALATIDATDSSGGDTATDAAKYPCPPTSAQIAAGDQCVVEYGVSANGSTFQVDPVPITFAAASSGGGTTTTTTGGSATTTTTASGSVGETSTSTTTTCSALSRTSTGSGPQVTANPATCLANGKVIQVTAKGFPANASGAVLECNDAPGQPTVALGAGVDVGCTSPLTALANTDAQGDLDPAFSVVKGVPGSALAKLEPTDSSGASTATDAARYPCPPTSAQIAAGDSCVIEYGASANGTQTGASVAITFADQAQSTTSTTIPSATTPAAVVSTSGSTTSGGSTAGGATTAGSSTSPAASTLAFTGSGPGVWLTLLGGLLLLDLGYLVVTTFYRPRELALRASRGVRRFFEED